MSFAAPAQLSLLLAVPVALIAVRLLLGRRARAERAWAARSMLSRLRVGGRPRPAWAISAIAAIVVLGLVLALARPRWGNVTRTVERRGVDVVVVLDTSLSMAARDVAPSRFWLARSLVRRLVRELPAERFGLVAAEGVGVVLSPLTVDGAVLDLLLESTEPGTLPVPGTRLGPAIERALDLFPEDSETYRVIVVLGDGEIHGESLEAAREALREAGVVVHAIGIGTADGAPIPLPGNEQELKHDRNGGLVISRLRRQPLEQLARATGGAYLEVSGVAADPTPIVDRIGAMRGRLHEATELTTSEERFQWPLAGGTAALAAWLAWGSFPPRRREEVA